MKNQKRKQIYKPLKPNTYTEQSLFLHQREKFLIYLTPEMAVLQGYEAFKSKIPWNILNFGDNEVHFHE